MTSRSTAVSIAGMTRISGMRKTRVSYLVLPLVALSFAACIGLALAG